MHQENITNTQVRERTNEALERMYVKERDREEEGKAEDREWMMSLLYRGIQLSLGSPHDFTPPDIKWALHYT